MRNVDLHSTPADLQKLLNAKGWLGSGEEIQSIAKAGEGNMNVVLRIQTNLRSFILKQSRPYVQKYQQIPAPLERISVEYQFYSTVRGKAIDPYIPAIEAYDEEDYLMLMEDLGTFEDMTSIYHTREISPKALQQLISVLKAIHQADVPATFPKNTALRELNHQHIFVLPFMEDNGFQLNDIQEGLQELSMPFKKDIALKTVVNSLGEKYLSEGEVLIHGDYYPGSWMSNTEQVFVIDPEFSFRGFPEFDLGVMAAHLIMASMDAESLNTLLHAYGPGLNSGMVGQIAGIEILRRIIGLAQLPLQRSIEEKAYLLTTARKLVLE
ncbi:phosphotransferase [Poritiphilus flavus]|uniref:Phosphotransferase n=1 Tax=Poritiphilus flavus TaxID=2697053 RepID=A0A6L9EES5_9FLAO|nr:phosphotransferase [Poritiphilus flavus]NAS12799.1 phosphotransferase [Poritiphilus flavus]